MKTIEQSPPSPSSSSFSSSSSVLHPNTVFDLLNDIPIIWYCYLRILNKVLLEGEVVSLALLSLTSHS